LAQNPDGKAVSTFLDLRRPDLEGSVSTEKPMRLVVVGAAGRMGQALIRAVHATKGVAVGGAVERPGVPQLGKDAGALAGVGEIGVPISDDPLPVFAKADGVLDFTAPAATVEFAGYAAQARIAHIIGTTGCTPEDDARIAAAARHTAIVKSGNMSLGVNLLAVLVEQAAKALDAGEFDIEVLEMHHRMKVDAPSGTALLLGAAAAKGRDIALSENSVRSRDGHTGARPAGSIGFATLRGGSVVGDHSVILAGAGERIVLSHHAEDRTLFATGAIKAALWAWHRKPGLYSMRDVLGL
jgi:4-hydroxy-tetrahydrodipicolinate reductase